MKVIIDTNFFLVPNQFGVDIFDELQYYDLATFSSCVEELKKLSKGKGADAKAAKIGLQLVGSNPIEIIETDDLADKAILAYAKKTKCMVATNDKELIRKLKTAGIKVFRLKQKKYIAEE